VVSYAHQRYQPEILHSNKNTSTNDCIHLWLQFPDGQEKRFSKIKTALEVSRQISENIHETMVLQRIILLWLYIWIIIKFWIG
jgi:hypothetical protein